MALSKQAKKIVRFYSLLFFVGLVTFLAPIMIALGAKGLDTPGVLNQLLVYGYAMGYAILLIVGLTIELKLTKGDDKYGDSIGFSSLGETPHFGPFKRFTQPQFFLLSLIFFGVLGLLATGFKFETFTGIGQLEQQFTPGAQILFSSTLIPGAENLGLALVIAACFIGLRIFARKVNMSKGSFRLISLFFIPFVGTGYWVVNHLLRYGAQAISLFKVGVFGYVQSLLTVSTGSFNPAWLLHISNNLFYDLRKFLALENIFIYAGLILVVLIIAYAIIYRGRLFGRKVPKEQI